MTVAREVMKAHIFSNSKDSFAVVLYNTVSTHARVLWCHNKRHKAPSWEGDRELTPHLHLPGGR